MRRLSSSIAYENPWLRVREDDLERDDGARGSYAFVEAPDIALIVPWDGGAFHLVGQYRYPIGERSWEFPSGSVDPIRDGDLESVAARELQEETGVSAASLELLGTLTVHPSTSTQRCSVFLATELTVGPAAPDPEEVDLVARVFTPAELRRMVAAGAIKDAKSLAALTLFDLRT